MSAVQRLPRIRNQNNTERYVQMVPDGTVSTSSKDLVFLQPSDDVGAQLPLLRNIAAQITGDSINEATTSPLPALQNLIPGISGCLILLYDEAGDFRPRAALDISREFRLAFELNEEKTHAVATVTTQAKASSLMYIPGNEHLRFLWRAAETEGIRMLWLFPWSRQDGRLLGTFLFTSTKRYSPNRQAIAAATLLANYLSLALGESYEMGEDRPHPSSIKGSTTNSPPLLGLNKRTDSDTISVLSHEILSPLTLIKGYAATLLQLSEVTTPEQRERYCRGIESATNRMIRLFEDLRDISQFEGVELRLSLEPTLLPYLLQKAVEEIQDQTTKHSFKLHLPRALPSINIDRQRILQVMTNLLGNAVKYSPNGGDIEVDAVYVRNDDVLRELFVEVPALKTPCVIISVSDHGIGIPKAELKRIFEKFYRSNNRQTRYIHGAGLGLYICRVIVTASSGHIWATSSARSGSTFHFSLPAS